MRVFAALLIPTAVSSALTEVIGTLKKHYHHLKVIKPQGLHITLLFFGELNEEQTGAIMEIMDSPDLHIEKIQASLGVLGCFPVRGNPRVIYCRIEAGKDQISAFYGRFYAMIKKLGAHYINNERDFIPHITLARNKYERIDVKVFKLLPALEQSFTIDSFVLYQSILKPHGAEYRPLKTVKFR